MAAETRQDVAAAPAVPHRAAGWRLGRPRGQLRWWHEVLLIAVGYAVYTVIRNAVPARSGRAFANASQIAGWERHLAIYHEHGINDWLAAHHDLAVVSNYWYATMHFVVTIGVAVWVLAKYPQQARSLRIAWYSTNVVALFGFWFYPLAPPRLMPGFIDTIMRLGIWGSWGKKGSADGASNQYAAMPSMHIGWSTWCAIVIVVLASSWWVKALAVAYPIVTFVVIVGTGNHYALDAVGGLLALAIGFVVARLLTGAWAFSRQPPADGRPEAVSAARPEAVSAAGSPPPRGAPPRRPPGAASDPRPGR